jgi:O-antigen ligase
MTPGISPHTRPLQFGPRNKAKVNLRELIANAAFFVFGVSAWVFKIGDDVTGTILPYSFAQLALPLTGIFALFLIVQIWRLHVPPLGIRAWSLRVVNFGFILVLIGTIIQFPGNSEYRVETVLFSIKWMLPWCSLLLVFTGCLFGGKKDWLVYGMLSGCALSVVCVEANRVGFPIPIAKMSPTRVAGLLSNPNQYGIILSSFAPLIVYVLHKRGWLPRLLGLSSIPLFAVGLFECLSKTNIMIWPITMALTLLLFSCNDAKRLFRAVALIALSAIGAASLLGSALAVLQAQGGRDFAGMTQFFEDPTSMKSLDDRQDAWDEALKYLHDRPILGEGPGWAPDHLMFLHAHNLFLQVWIDVGILGLLGAIVITIGILIRNWEVVHAVITRQIPLDDEARLQIAVAIGLVAAVFGNSMSASLDTETMVSFSLLLGLSFSNPKIVALALGKRSVRPVSVQNKRLSNPHPGL